MKQIWKIFGVIIFTIVAIICSSTAFAVTIADMQVGAYVTYRPTAITCDLTAITGVTQDALVPSETTQWRVLRNDGTTVELVSADSVGLLRLGSTSDTTIAKTHYANLIQILKKISEAYTDGEIAVSGRGLGYNGTSAETIPIENVSFSYIYSNNITAEQGDPYDDTYYRTNNTIADIEVLKEYNMLHTKTINNYVWLAARKLQKYVYTTYTEIYFCEHVVNASGNLEEECQCMETGSSITVYEASHGVRPVIILKSEGIQVTGSGSLDSPYVLCVGHAGGTHENGGTCTNCGEIYQLHSQTETIVNYTKTATQHTPNYACSVSGCSTIYTGTALNHSGATHTNGGICTICSYVYDAHTQTTTVSSYTQTATQHTPNYACGNSSCATTYAGTAEEHSGETHENGGKCTACDYIYKTHSHSGIIVAYTPEEDTHTIIYACSLSGCTSTYEGEKEAHTRITSCDKCGWTNGEIGYYLRLDNGNVRTIVTVMAGELVDLGYADYSAATYVVNTGTVTLQTVGNRRQFIMPAENVSITIGPN